MKLFEIIDSQVPSFNIDKDPARALIGQKLMFYQSIRHKKACFIVLGV